jgi:type II secretory pathway component GspD/PulD (secretin)
MRFNFAGRGRWTMKFAKAVFGAALVAMLSGTGAWAQTATPTVKTEVGPEKPNNDAARTPRVDYPTLPLQTYYLMNANQPNDDNEILTAIRSTLPPEVRIYLDSGQNAILFRGTPEQNATVQKIINDLDRPKKRYRLTFTTTDVDNGKRIGTQHFAMVVIAGWPATLKEGSKVPVATGSYDAGSAGAAGRGAQTQFQYLDVGMNFAATLTEVSGGVVLKSKVEQLSVAEEKSGVGGQDPIIRQTTLEGTSLLTLGKVLVVGSVDIPGSTRHVDVDAMVELVP